MKYTLEKIKNYISALPDIVIYVENRQIWFKWKGESKVYII